jgi:hypothetical protein
MRKSKSNYRTLGLIVPYILLTSCDPLMELNLTISNQSEKELIVEFKAVQNSALDTTFTLVTGEHKTVFSSPQYGKAKHYDCCPCEVWVLKIITKDSTEIVTKDYKDKNNWVKSFKTKHSVNCQFDVYNSDLE